MSIDLQQMINKIEIDTHLFVKWKWNKQIKLDCFRQKQHWKNISQSVSQSPKVNPGTLRDLQMEI